MTKNDELQWSQDGDVFVARLVIAGTEVEIRKVFGGESWFAFVGTLDPASPRGTWTYDQDENTAVDQTIAKAEKMLTEK